MHFEILIEDSSGKTALEILLPKIISCQHNTFNIHAYRGMGHLPKNLKPSSDPKKQVLLNKLPSLIRGHGKTFAGYGSSYPAILIIVCDLDKRCLHEFRQELLNCLEKCETKPETYFCIAIEEGEAWFLGDIDAIRTAYPRAKDTTLNSYQNDSICGTWEILADALHPGGSKSLSQLGRQSVGKEKAAWASNIPPHMNVDANQSPSFCYFREKLRHLASK